MCGMLRGGSINPRLKISFSYTKCIVHKYSILGREDRDNLCFLSSVLVEGL